MPVTSGQLRHRVTIQAGTSTRGPVGRDVVTWSTTATRWARVIPLTERLQWLQNSERGIATHRIIFRGRLSFDLKTTRFLYRGDVYFPEEPEADPLGDGAWTVVEVRYDPEAKV